MTPTPDNLVETLDRFQDDWTGRTFVVGWSGGLDSTVLLDLLRRVAHRHELELVAVHVHHHLHEHARTRAAFCQATAANWKLRLLVEEISPREATPSLEAQLRRQRYGALGEAAERVGADLVLTAHQANDAVETALMRFLRGTGGAGLTNLAPKNAFHPEDEPGPVVSWPNIALLRPLLSLDRDSLSKYARERRLKWRDDPANTNPSFTRNRLRQRVVPHLKREAGSLQPMLRTLDNVADETAHLSSGVRRLREQSRRPAPSFGAIAFETKSLAATSRTELTALLRRSAHELPSPPRWTRERLEAAVDAVDAVHSGRSNHERLALAGATLVVEPTRVTLAQSHGRGGRDLLDRRAVPRSLPLEPEVSVRWFDQALSGRILTPDTPTDFPTRRDTAWFDADHLFDPLKIRGPIPGEQFSALGASGTTSLSDVLRSHCIPRSRRWHWPCLASPGRSDDQEGECLWVCGLRQSQSATITASTEHVFEVKITRLEP